MHVTVKILKRKFITLRVNPDDMIEDIKKKIQDKESILPGHQSLFFNGRPLQNDRTLADYMIPRKATIYLYLKGMYIYAYIYIYIYIYKIYKKEIHKKEYIYI